MAVILLALLIAAALWAVSLLKWPFRPCGKCQARGTNPGSSRKRWGTCKRCHGSKQVRRFGATAVHRFWWSVLGAALHRKRLERVEKAKQKARYPES